MTAPLELPRSTSGRSPLDVARLAALEAGAIILARFRTPQEVDVKGRGNLVTRADHEAERAIERVVREEFPGHHVYGEETQNHTTFEGWVWVVDPLDGTRNYVSGIPFFCVNIALCLDGEPVLGLTYDPNHDEQFWAQSGLGAYVDDRPLRASDRPDVASSVVGMDLGYSDATGKATLRLAYELFPNVQCIRIPGSAALGLAYAAAGRLDLFFHRNVYPWDIAAGIVLVREAGGAITAPDGGAIRITSGGFVAGGPAVHADFLRRYGDALAAK